MYVCSVSICNSKSVYFPRLVMSVIILSLEWNIQNRAPIVSILLDLFPYAGPVPTQVLTDHQPGCVQWLK